jgi:NAD(P)-dependent dehydrogenase (short-subunit alcohol dehydrogenase family)
MNRAVLITGATSGLGQSMKDYFLKKGDTVYDVSQTGTYKCDLRDPFQITHFANLFAEEVSFVDVLINNAGFLELNEDVQHWESLFNIFLYTPSYLMKTIKVKRHIINIASVSGMKADPDTPMYGALKAGLISLTKSYAIKLAPDVRVNCISPGFFNTNLVPGNAPQDLLAEVPLYREAHPGEIISVVKMLDRNQYITGANIVIDGGLTA